MKIKKLFLLSLLVLLLIGVSYATEANNDTTTTTDTPEVVKDTSTTANNVDNTINEETINDKEITKQVNTNKTTKTASKTYDVEDFDTLHNVLTTDRYDTVIVNIKSNIKLAGDIGLNNAIETLTINGNGKTIDSDNNYQFFRTVISNVTINNLKITNCKAGYDGTIENNFGHLSITNCTLQNNNGGIYNYMGTLTITDCILQNNNGGAVNYYGNLTIYNTIFNNKATYIGEAINNHYGNLTIYNSTFNNYTADYRGGAIMNYYGNLIIYTSTFENNTASEMGGAIHNYEGTTVITHTIFNNNKAKMGGAIYNYYSNITLTNTTLNNNTAETGGAIYQYEQNNDVTFNITKTTLQENTANYGGAIYNLGRINIEDSTLTGNIATECGGAINNYGTITLTNTTLQENTANYGGALAGSGIISGCTFTQNTANTDGGAINNLCGKLNITDSTFLQNKAGKDGGAVYGDFGSYMPIIIITDSLFSQNRANTTGKAIIVLDPIDCWIENNTNSETSKYSSTICLLFYNVTITNNVFDDGPYTTITISSNNTKPYVNDKIILTFSLKDYNNKAVSDEKIIATINGKNYTLTTNTEGIATTVYTPTATGTYTIIATYNGNTKYLESSNKMTLTVKQPTWIKLAYMPNVEYGSTVKIVGRLLNGNTPVKYNYVNVTVNNKVYKVKTDSAGYIRLNYTVNNYKEQKVSFKYNENTLYAASSNSTSFKVKQPTWIKIASVSNVEYGSTVKLVGRLLNGTSAVKYVPVNVTVNGKTYKVKTDGAGYIRINHTVNSYDVQKVTFKFAGNTLYAASTNSTTFKVKQPTWIKMANMANVQYGSTVKLVGRLLYNGTTAVKYTAVTVTVNDNNYNVKTNGAGYFSLEYTVNNYDDQKVTFKFAGNSLYTASTNSTTFKVKQPTWIKHASIGKVKQGSTVKIVGRVLYNGTTAVKYVPVNVTVNGKVYKLKTDGAGYYRLNYTATTLGTVTFTSNFAGNTLYLASTNSTKFTVVKS